VAREYDLADMDGTWREGEYRSLAADRDRWKRRARVNADRAWQWRKSQRSMVGVWLGEPATAEARLATATAALDQERQGARVQLKHIEQQDERLAAATAALAKAGRELEATKSLRTEAEMDADDMRGALAEAVAERDALRAIVANECPIGALDIATSLRVELQHTQDALAEAERRADAWKESAGKLSTREVTIGREMQRVITSQREQLAAAESHAARHHAELAGAEAVIGTLREELGEARKALAYIASRPEGQDEPGERNARRAAWRMAQRARVALGRSHKGWLPTVDDLAGSDPGFTGGLDSVEYVRRMRDEDEGATGGEAM
jgi:hypothetical protein